MLVSTFDIDIELPKERDKNWTVKFSLILNTINMLSDNKSNKCN